MDGWDDLDDAATGVCVAEDAASPVGDMHVLTREERSQRYVAHGHKHHRVGQRGNALTQSLRPELDSVPWDGLNLVGWRTVRIDIIDRKVSSVKAKRLPPSF